MPMIKIALDDESFRRLADVAIELRRAIALQAEVLVLMSLGRWPVRHDPHPSATEAAAGGSL
jgi:hypothetical protein